MDILSLSFLLIVLAVYDEIFNGQLKISKKLLDWFDRNGSDRSKPSKR
jgi:hypothetical protein